MRARQRRVDGLLGIDGALSTKALRVTDYSGLLVGDSLPRISVIKMSHYSQNTSSQLAEPSAEILLQIADKLNSSPLAGFVAEGEAPYGNMTTEPTKAPAIAVYSGMPVVSVGRGNAGGPTALRPYNVFIEGNNLSAPKARLLLMACMMKFGSMPTAIIPEKPSHSERLAVQDLISKYQEIFDTH